MSNTPLRFAGIDIGSNSVRLIVAEMTADGTDYRVLDDHKETTRLARGLAKDGELQTDAINHTVTALKRMKSIVDGFQVQKFEVIATSAVREALNRDEFVQLVKEQVGLQIEIISTQEEGLLSFQSAMRRFNFREGNIVHMDLGGGSCELVFASHGSVEQVYSLPVGAVRMTESCFFSDPPSEADFETLSRRLRKKWKEQIGPIVFQPHFMIGAGGTFTALANICQRLQSKNPTGVSGVELTRSDVRHALDYIKRLPLPARRSVPGLNADRADIIIAGVAVIEKVMKKLKVNRLIIHDRGVRDGLILRMIDNALGRKPTQAEPIDRESVLKSAEQFGQLCAFEASHAQHVAKLAVQLFDQIQNIYKLPDTDRLLLEVAAWLHEIGQVVNYEKHHKHSYHLIKHGNLRGLTSHQKELIGQIARYHRKSGPKKKHEDYAKLTTDDQVTVKRLSALLRIADGLDRSHTKQVTQISCVIDPECITLYAHSVTNPEVDIWGAKQKGKLFRKFFDTDLEVTWKGS